MRIISCEDEFYKMKSLTIQQDLGSGTSRDVSALPLTPSHAKGAQSPSHSSFSSVDNPLLCRFLSALGAKEIASPPRGYQTFILQPGAYTKTLESLRGSDLEVWGYVSDKLRHDLVDDKFLIIKMHGRIHELTVWAMSDLIRSQLAAIAENPSNENTKRLIHDIRPALSSHVKLSDPKTFREPDQQFFIKGSYYPGVVIEIAYSESFEQLQHKAYDFTVRSGGEVQLVIGLERAREKSFKISTWQPEFYQFKNKDAVRMKTVVDQDIIRDSDGTLRPGSLRFHLQDFGRNLATRYPDADLTKEIVLDYGVLAECLIDAEQCDVPSPPNPDIIMSESPFSSEEKLTPEDEKNICDLERRSAARSEASDPDYS